MVSAEASAALVALEHGANFNVVHTISRELIRHGYATVSFGRLEITELGRSYARAFIRPAEGVADLSQSRVIDPMSNPMGTPVTPLTEAQLSSLSELRTAVDTSSMSDWRRRCVEAAGIASGKTGEWPTPLWVEEFIHALEAEETLST